MAHDKLVLLAEAVGAIAPMNPEQSTVDHEARRDPGELVQAIEASLGMAITPPPIDGGLLKLDTGRGLLGEHDLNAIYTAHLVDRLLAQRRGAAICEIGGGSGRVAHWSRRMGRATYTLVDLPLVNVVQGFYALKTMPAEQVVLYGERPPGGTDGCLRILPAHALEELQDASFDLILNQDSMPEMHEDVASDYLRWVARTCRGVFVSINHANKHEYGPGLRHTSVPELVARLGGLRLRDRQLYWLRRGYVLETYEPEPAAAR